MSCATTLGTYVFGVPADQSGVTVTQQITVTKKSDRKEGRDRCGNVVGVAYYNETHETTIEGMVTSNPSITPGQAYSLSTVFGSSGAYYVDECTMTYANEEFAKFSIKATRFVG